MIRSDVKNELINSLESTRTIRGTLKEAGCRDTTITELYDALVDHMMLSVDRYVVSILESIENTADSAGNINVEILKFMVNNDSTKKARNKAMRIWRDLKDRNGYTDDVDKTIKEEIIKTWTEIILEDEKEK